MSIMYRFLPALAAYTMVAGCAGNVADYMGDRTQIMAPQLIRYGLTLGQSRCVGEKIAAALNPLQLRRFARAATAVTQGYFDPDRLTVRDLSYVASRVEGVGFAFDSAVGECHANPPTAPDPGTLPPPPTAPAAPPSPAWLNLGAAASGQSIAVDAASIRQEDRTRTAWFRLTDPGAAQPSDVSFLLLIDCGRRTINSRTRRRLDAAGAEIERRDFPDNPLPVQGGTVMEIAFLSMCT
jgi:hypothetical protein